MERLTEWDEFGNADIIGVNSADLMLHLEYDELNLVTDALNRLAAYEDTGLSPQEVRELTKAKQEGRLVVLPCMVGDAVYFLIPELEMGEGGFNLSGLFISEPHRITEVGTRGFWTSGLPRDEPDGMHDFTPWGDLGKTAFLTREEADAALRKEQSDET